MYLRGRRNKTSFYSNVTVIFSVGYNSDRLRWIYGHKCHIRSTKSDVYVINRGDELKRKAFFGAVAVLKRQSMHITLVGIVKWAGNASRSRAAWRLGGRIRTGMQ